MAANMLFRLRAQRDSKGLGLGLLPPAPRLAIVVLATSGFVWINTLPAAAVAFGFGMMLIVLNKKRNLRLVLPLVGVTVLSYFLGNILFSPPGPSSKQLFIFRINQLGLVLGLIGGLKRGAMISVSLAWLLCTPLPEFYDSLTYFRLDQKWLTLFLRNIQSMKREVILLRQSFAIRCPPAPWYAVRTHLLFFRLALQAILFRLFDAISTITYASETHHLLRRSGQGGIGISELFVRYSHSGPTVLRHLSLAITEGEFVYLAGRSKAGKTTLMRTIAGYIPRIAGEYAGSVLIGGLDISDLDLAQIADYVRLVPSDSSLSIIGLTVGQDIMMTASTEYAARKYLSIMGIEHLWSRQTTTLSGGEQTRLVLADLLASGVKVVLLDSPLEPLDPSGRRDFLNAIRDFRAETSATVLVSDPSFQELRNHAERFVLIEDGNVVLDRPISELTQQDLERSGLTTTDALRVPDDRALSQVPVAEMRDVEVVLGDCRVLRSLSLFVYEGECLVVIGSNGGGKTTTFLTLSGVLRPSSGKVRLYRSVGFVFQNAALQMIEMTSRGELELKPKLMHFESDKLARVVERELNWNGLKGDEWPGDLHPQDARFLAIGAMKTCADIMIFDEPTVGLDLPAVVKFRNLVQQLNEQKRATILITHDPRVMEVADRILCIEKGRISFEKLNSRVIPGCST